MLPQIDNSINPDVQTIILPSKTYKIDNDRISGYIDGIDAIKQAVYHILQVERYSCPIYDDNYGVELEQYQGVDFEYIETTIEDTLREALTQDNRINDVIVTNIERISNDIALVEFDVISTQGKITMEVNLNV